MNSELPADWHNVFHITKGRDNSEMGDRLPGLWANKAKYFHTCTASNGNRNYCYNYPYQLNQIYKFEISQMGNENGKAMFSIKINGSTIHEVINTTPTILSKAHLYLSDPWYSSFASYGKLSKLKIANIDSEGSNLKITTLNPQGRKCIE